MARCVWRDEPCARTDIRGRGLCTMHYGRAIAHNFRLDDDYPTVWRSFEELRDAGCFICRCAFPAGPPDGECARCYKLILTAEYAAFLRAKYGLGAA